jgi:hypothetical protein
MLFYILKIKIGKLFVVVEMYFTLQNTEIYNNILKVYLCLLNALRAILLNLIKTDLI